jgi:hypothetical protein
VIDVRQDRLQLEYGRRTVHRKSQRERVWTPGEPDDETIAVENAAFAKPGQESLLETRSHGAPARHW